MPEKILTGSGEHGIAGRCSTNNVLKARLPVAKPEWGTKRQCQGCGSRFYDLGKTPIVCPDCGEEFKVVVATRPAPKPEPKPAKPPKHDRRKRSTDADSDDDDDVDDIDDDIDDDDIDDDDDVDIDDDDNDDDEDLGKVINKDDD